MSTISAGCMLWLDFSTDAFRRAIAEADVEVITLGADVCGVMDEQYALRPLSSQKVTLVHIRGVPARAGSAICVAGRLDDRVEPYSLNVTALR